MCSKITLTARGKEIVLLNASSRQISSGGETAILQVPFGISHKGTKRRWLHYGGMPSNVGGYQVMRNSVISAITVNLANVSTGIVHIRKNNETADLFSLELTNEEMKKVTGLNIALYQNDRLKVFSESATCFDYPLVVLEIHE